MAVELIVIAILGLHPEWRPDACERVFATEYNKAACERTRDDGAAWAAQLATFIEAEATRQAVDWTWVVAVIDRESAFSRIDVCPYRIELDRITSRTVVDEEEGKERVCWTYFLHREMPEATNCQPVIVVGEEDGHLVMDRCAAGEAGLMQIVPGEARPGQVVPATGEELPRAAGARRVRIMDPQVNISLGVQALAVARDECCCTTSDDGTRSCDSECQASTARWLGAYNTGRCSGTAFDRYVVKVRRHRERAVEYLCTVKPESDVCSTS